MLRARVKDKHLIEDTSCLNDRRYFVNENLVNLTNLTLDSDEKDSLLIKRLTSNDIVI